MRRSPKSHGRWYREELVGFSLRGSSPGGVAFEVRRGRGHAAAAQGKLSPQHSPPPPAAASTLSDLT